MWIIEELLIDAVPACQIPHCFSGKPISAKKIVEKTVALRGRVRNFFGSIFGN
jgi:hypothetical protein